MSLALRLGRTLGELCDSMSSYEFSLWLAYYKEAPWDEFRADYRAGVIAAAIANYAGMRRRDGSSPVRPIEFMPWFKMEHDEAEEAEVSPIAHFSKLR